MFYVILFFIIVFIVLFLIIVEIITYLRLKIETKHPEHKLSFFEVFRASNKYMFHRKLDFDEFDESKKDFIIKYNKYVPFFYYCIIAISFLIIILSCYFPEYRGTKFQIPDFFK